MNGQRRQRKPVVELYERIVEQIRTGTYPPGSTLPSEPTLATALQVSRPALREALLLLQEDGVINVRRGVGRTVSQAPPRRGVERLQPVEDLLGADNVQVHPLRSQWEEPTDLVLQHLSVPAAGEVRFRESSLDVDGVPTCLVEEWGGPDPALAACDPALPEALATAEALPHTMLHTLVTASSGRLTATSTLSATVLGQRRGTNLDRPADTPAVLLTQTVFLDTTAVLLAKYLLPSGAPSVPLRQVR